MKTASLSLITLLWQSYTVNAQGRDCGRFTMNCAGAEGACNNACYYINCVANTPANPDRVTYIGNGNTAENDKNRQQSGCSAAQGGSVCRNFPFSQNFIDANHRHLTQANDCDEWPPAASQQNNFAAGTVRNSLRCIPASENRAAGARLGNFINDVGNGRQNRNTACSGPLNRGDYFGVDFDLTGANMNSLQFCVANPACTQDGYQFHMTQKPTQNGKISSYYDPQGTDSRYQLSEQTVASELFQCSVKISRPDDNTFNWEVTDTGNVDQGSGSSTVTGATGTFTATGLPLGLVIGKTGTKGSQLTFEYGQQNQDPDYFTWTSDDVGDGRGPATNAGSPYEYCHQTTGSNQEWQTECWFGCYE